MNKHILLFLIFFSSLVSSAQLLIDQNWNLKGLSGATVAFADYDNDGDQDFILTGFGSTTAEWSGFYRIDNGIPVLIDSTMIKVSNGSCNWGDFDHDGDLDLLLNGQTNSNAQTALYRNDGTPLLSLVPNTGLPGFIGCMRWIDYDRDQFPDLIMSGMIDGSFIDTTILYHNDGNGSFSHTMAFPFSLFEADIQVSDYDRDSLPDFFITGRGTFSFNGFCGLFHNDGNGQFSQTPDAFRRLFTGTAKFGDYDQDGDVDLLMDGIDSTNAAFTLIYENNSGVFSELPNVLPMSGEPGSVDWADIDGDGDFDIAISGSHLMRNDGNNSYTDISPWDTLHFALPIVFNDYDEDGDRDVFFLSYFGFTGTTMYRNNTITNTTEIENSEKIQVYPNPAGSTLHVLSKWYFESAVKVSDINGKLLLSENLSSLHNNLDVSRLATGVYFIELQNNNTNQKLRFMKM